MCLLRVSRCGGDILLVPVAREAPGGGGGGGGGPWPRSGIPDFTLPDTLEKNFVRELASNFSK